MGNVISCAFDMDTACVEAELAHNPWQYLRDSVAERRILLEKRLLAPKATQPFISQKQYIV